MEISATTVIACASFALSVISLSWQFYLGRRDRAVVAIRANVSDVVPSEPGFKPVGKVVFVSLSNRGRRPITISSVAWSTADKSFRMLVPSNIKLSRLDAQQRQFWENSFPKLPTTLAESAALSFYWPIEAFKEGPPRNVVVYDSHGDMHKLPWRKARKLRKAVARALSARRDGAAEAA